MKNRASGVLTFFSCSRLPFLPSPLFIYLVHRHQGAPEPSRQEGRRRAPHRRRSAHAEDRLSTRVPLLQPNLFPQDCPSSSWWQGLYVGQRATAIRLHPGLSIGCHPRQEPVEAVDLVDAFPWPSLLCFRPRMRSSPALSLSLLYSSPHTAPLYTLLFIDHPLHLISPSHTPLWVPFVACIVFRFSPLHIFLSEIPPEILLVYVSPSHLLNYALKRPLLLATNHSTWSNNPESICR